MNRGVFPGTPNPLVGFNEKKKPRRNPMRFLLPILVGATMVTAASAVDSKAEAATTPGIGTLPLQTKTYTPVEKAGYRRRYYRRGYYGYGGYPYYGYGYRRPYYGYAYRPYGYYGYGWRPGIIIGIGRGWGWRY